MAKAQDQVKSVLAQIDAIITMLERHKLSLDVFDDLSSSISPLSFLLDLLRHLGLTYDEIVEWLAQYIVTVTPLLEIALKGVLLAKLKSNIDCNSDPRIPKYLREDIGGINDMPILNSFVGENENVGDASGYVRGIEIDLTSIDYSGMLNNSPMSDRSQYMYFGTKKYYTVEGINKKKYNYEEVVKECIENGLDTNQIKKFSEIDSIYELVRAKDMNAFLWFVLNKAKFLNVENLILNGGGCILGEINEEVDVNDIDNNISLGGCYKQTIGNNQYGVMGLCIKNTPQYFLSGELKEPSTIHISENEVQFKDIASEIKNVNHNIKSYVYTIVPVSNVWNGCNWYVNRSLFNDFWDKQKRDYSQEFALFRLAMKYQDDIMTNKLHFTIKPSPNIIVPNIDVEIKTKTLENDKLLTIQYTGDMPWNFHKILFDVNGQQNYWGNFSVIVGDECKENDYNEYTKYCLQSPMTKEKLTGVFLYVNKKTGEYYLKSDGCEDVKTALYECYHGLTIYDFNYDFIMGMRFFDATVITAKLIEALTNIRLGVDVKFNSITSDYQMRISKIVKEILESKGYESTDCFYSFSNDEFEMLQEDSELKRSQLYSFQDEGNRAIKVQNDDVYSILNDFNSQATLEENINVINRAINNASVSITNEVMPEDKTSLELDFITKAIEMLASIFVESLLSPKVLMILVINQKMMGEKIENEFSIEKVLQTYTDTIIALVNEIVEMVLTKILTFVLDKVKMLLDAAVEILVLEQVEYYMRLMRQMIENCAFKSPKSKLLNSTLDAVDYADIDVQDIPITNEC